jgi:hypothetical protein
MKAVGLAFLVATCFVCVSCIGLRWQYVVIYWATTPEARLELATRLKENPGILSAPEPYSVGLTSGARGGKVDMLTVGTPAALQHTESFKALRLKIEEGLGPKLMKSLKITTQTFPSE